MQRVRRSPSIDHARMLPAMLVLVALVATALGGTAPDPSAEAPGTLELHLIDVGEGDAILLNLPGGERLLVDGGQPAAGPTVVAYLQQQEVESLDLLVATHPHADHIGGLALVLEALPVGEAWVELGNCVTNACRTLDAALAAGEVPTRAVRAGDLRQWGSVRTLVLNPQEPLLGNANDNSVVILLYYGSLRVLLAGDVEAAAEARLIEVGISVEASILKVAHHGGNTSSGDAFLSAVRPREALISVGPNSYGHPHPDALARLTAAGARTWRTDEVGTVVVSSNGIVHTVSAASTPIPTEAPSIPTLAPPPPSATPRPTPPSLYLVLLWRGEG